MLLYNNSREINMIIFAYAPVYTVYMIIEIVRSGLQVDYLSHGSGPFVEASVNLARLASALSLL